MPFHWTKISSSTAKQRLKELKDVKKKYAGADIVGNQVFRAGADLYVLVKLPDDRAKKDAFLTEIGRQEGGFDLVDSDGN